MMFLNEFIDLAKENSIELETDPDFIKGFINNSLNWENKVHGVLFPKSKEEVKALVLGANQYNCPLYPISKGFNWGMGARCPVEPGCFIVDLSKMDKIIQYEDQFGTIRVAPGVSFQQATEFLSDQESKFYIPCIGGPPGASLIGNALERGDALGPHGERITHACAITVILGNGKEITTEFGAFGDRLRDLSRWGVGPGMGGLFSQSNFGIVVEMTFWLPLKYSHFQTFVAGMSTDDQLTQTLTNLRTLQMQGVIQTNGLIIWNSYKMIATESQYPWELTGGRTPLQPDEIAKIKSVWAKYRWICVGALYAHSSAVARDQKKSLKKALRGSIDRLFLFGKEKVLLVRSLSKLLGAKRSKQIGLRLDDAYTKSVFHGNVTTKSSKSLYWRKKFLPEVINPQKDGCELMWVCLAVPYIPETISKLIRDMESTILDHGFEPQIAFTPLSHRLIYIFPTIIFDKTNPGDVEKAEQCHDALLKLAEISGAIPYRLGIFSMQKAQRPLREYSEFLADIKNALDPKGIISPGRYSFK